MHIHVRIRRFVANRAEALARRHLAKVIAGGPSAVPSGVTAEGRRITSYIEGPRRSYVTACTTGRGATLVQLRVPGTMHDQVALIFEGEVGLFDGTTPQPLAGVAYKLHRSVIAARHRDGTWALSLCGWNTTTTRRRLGDLTPVRCSTRRGQASFNGVPIGDDMTALLYPGMEVPVPVPSVRSPLEWLYDRAGGVS